MGVNGTGLLIRNSQKTLVCTPESLAIFKINRDELYHK